MSPTSRAVRFFSCASRGLTRLADPSPTKITPGRPITRCTASKWPVAATPGVTRHLPFRLSSAHAAAPVCPSALRYTDFCARLPKMMKATSAPSTTPSGIIMYPVKPPAMIPIATATATIRTNAPIMYGSSRLSSLRCIWNACHSWLRRCLEAALRAALASALAAFVAAGSRGFAICSGYGGTRRDGLGIQPSGPIGRPDEGTGQHSGEAEAVGELLVVDELLGLNPALHRVVAQRRPQVLGDRDDVAAGIEQVAKRGAHLVGCLAHAEDEVGLGDEAVLAGG